MLLKSELRLRIDIRHKQHHSYCFTSSFYFYRFDKVHSAILNKCPSVRYRTMNQRCAWGHDCFLRHPYLTQNNILFLLFPQRPESSTLLSFTSASVYIKFHGLFLSDDNESIHLRLSANHLDPILLNHYIIYYAWYA